MSEQKNLRKFCLAEYLMQLCVLKWKVSITYDNTTIIFTSFWPEWISEEMQSDLKLGGAKELHRNLRVNNILFFPFFNNSNALGG